MDEKADNKNDELLNFFDSIGTLIGRRITGAAYSERGGEPVIILNLIDENQTCTAWYMPLDLTAFNKKPVEDK